MDHMLPWFQSCSLPLVREQQELLIVTLEGRFDGGVLTAVRPAEVA